MFLPERKVCAGGNSAGGQHRDSRHADGRATGAPPRQHSNGRHDLLPIQPLRLQPGGVDGRHASAHARHLAYGHHAGKGALLHRPLRHRHEATDCGSGEGTEQVAAVQARRRRGGHRLHGGSDYDSYRIFDIQDKKKKKRRAYVTGFARLFQVCPCSIVEALQGYSQQCVCSFSGALELK